MRVISIVAEICASVLRLTDSKGWDTLNMTTLSAWTLCSVLWLHLIRGFIVSFGLNSQRLRNTVPIRQPMPNGPLIMEYWVKRPARQPITNLGVWSLPNSNFQLLGMTQNVCLVFVLCKSCTETVKFLGLPLLTWICNNLPGKVWDEITYPFLNFNGCTVEV